MSFGNKGNKGKGPKYPHQATVGLTPLQYKWLVRRAGTHMATLSDVVRELIATEIVRNGVGEPR
jgi:hypothetical protein